VKVNQSFVDDLINNKKGDAVIEDSRFKSMFEDTEFKRDESVKPTVSKSLFLFHPANLV
jgi:hypothetical protein